MALDIKKNKIENVAENTCMTAYRNEVNVLDLSELSVIEARVFFLFISRLWGGRDSAEISFSDLRQCTNIAKHGDGALEDVVKSMAVKIAKVTYSTIGEGFTSVGSFFNLITVKNIEKLVEVNVNPAFKNLLCGDSGLTIFNIEDFSKLGSRYSQGLFVILKQWRSIGKTPPIAMSEASAVFRKQSAMDPKSLVQKVVPTAVNECSEYFPGLKAHFIKGETRGNPVEAVWFSFEPDKKCTNLTTPGEWARWHTEVGRF